MNINGAGPTSAAEFTAVKAAFEGCYSAMGITCADVGGLYDATNSAYYADFSPCEDASTDYAPILAYRPGSKVTDHANIDLDQAAMEDALADMTASTAKDIY